MFHLPLLLQCRFQFIFESHTNMKMASFIDNCSKLRLKHIYISPKTMAINLAQKLIKVRNLAIAQIVSFPKLSTFKTLPAKHIYRPNHDNNPKLGSLPKPECGPHGSISIYQNLATNRQITLPRNLYKTSALSRCRAVAYLIRYAISRAFCYCRKFCCQRFVNDEGVKHLFVICVSPYVRQKGEERRFDL